VKLMSTTLVLVVTLCGTSLFFTQTRASTSQPNDDQRLKMTKIGEGFMFGRHASFRTYETPDHIEALVWYGEFRSEEESKLATEVSLKKHNITGTEQVKDQDGHVIGNRIIATPKEEKKAFMVIRTHGSNYWIIQSISLAVAMQVDGLIEPPIPLPAFAANSSSCDRSVELLSEQLRLSKEEQKRVHQVRGMVGIEFSADGNVVGAKAMSLYLPSDGSEAGLSSAEAANALLSEARSMKFKTRPGCGDFRYNLSF
jgi:hypothetical protein